MADILEFFEMVYDLFVLPFEMLESATVALDSFEFSTTLLYQYLGYMHFAMGDALYIAFSSVALVMIGASLWSFILKGIDFLKSVLPFQ